MQEFLIEFVNDSAKKLVGGYEQAVRSPQPAALDTLAPIAAEQDGYVTAAQALQVGVDYPRMGRLAADGYLERVEHGVYRIAVGTPVAPRVPEDIYIQYLALDAKRLPWEKTKPRVVVSHESAGYLLGIGTYPADAPVFTSERRRTTTLAAEIRIAPLPAEDWSFRELGRIPVTTAARTVVDLAFFGIERDYVQRALTDAIEQRLTTLDQVARVVERRRRSARKHSIAWLVKEIDYRRRQS